MQLNRTRTKFDDWRSLSLSLYMTLVGYGVMVGIPVISTAWSEKLGYTAEQVGRVAGADMGGLSLVTVHDLPIVEGGGDQHLCYGDQLLLSGSGAHIYNWSNLTNPVIDNVPLVTYINMDFSNEYYLEGIDTNGCVNYDTVMVTIGMPPEVNGGGDATVCYGDSVVNVVGFV